MKVAQHLHSGRNMNPNHRPPTTCHLQQTMNHASKNFKDLRVWQQSIDLVKNVYRVTQNFPKEEIYGLTSQIRRAAVSIPSNIAEGQARKSHAEFKKFLTYSSGSAAELETQLVIARELEFLDKSVFANFQSRLEEIQKMTFALMNYLR